MTEATQDDGISMLDALLCPTCKGIGLVEPPAESGAQGQQGSASEHLTATGSEARSAEHREAINTPSPLPEGQDLAELRHRAEVAEAAAALMAEQRDNALLRVETAEREAKENWQKFVDANEAKIDAEATITRLQADLARAREALGPFADAWDECGDAYGNDSRSAWESALAMRVTYGDFRRASEVFTSLSERGEEGSSGSERAASVASQPDCSTAQRPDGGEIAWLLESKSPWPGGAVYWFALLDKPYRAPRSGSYHWYTYTADPNAALKFASKDEAEAYRDRRGGIELGVRVDLVATEHEWPLCPAESRSIGCAGEAELSTLPGMPNESSPSPHQAGGVKR